MLHMGGGFSHTVLLCILLLFYLNKAVRVGSGAGVAGHKAKAGTSLLICVMVWINLHFSQNKST